MNASPLRRRKPLTRKTPLRRSAPLTRKSPLRCKPRPKHTPAEQAHMDAVQALGCLICRAPALIHHVRSLDGVRITRNHLLVLPLCWAHHSADSAEGFHHGTKPWSERHGTQKELLALVDRKLAERRACA